MRGRRDFKVVADLEDLTLHRALPLTTAAAREEPTVAHLRATPFRYSPPHFPIPPDISTHRGFRGTRPTIYCTPPQSKGLATGGPLQDDRGSKRWAIDYAAHASNTSTKGRTWYKRVLFTKGLQLEVEYTQYDLVGQNEGEHSQQSTPNRAPPAEHRCSEG